MAHLFALLGTSRGQRLKRRKEGTCEPSDLEESEKIEANMTEMWGPGQGLVWGRKRQNEWIIRVGVTRRELGMWDGNRTPGSGARDLDQLA